MKLKLTPYFWTVFFFIGLIDFWNLEFLDKHRVFVITLRYLIPLAIVLSVPLVYWLTNRYDKYKYSKNRVLLNSVLYSLVISVFNLAILQGYISLGNRLIGKQIKIQITGTIEESPTGELYFTSNDVAENTISYISFPIKQNSKLDITTNDHQTITFTKGSLGILYIK